MIGLMFVGGGTYLIGYWAPDQITPTIRSSSPPFVEIGLKAKRK
jgi:hypothetical protein